MPRSKVTVSTGHEWFVRYFFAGLAVIIFGWSGVKACYTRGMDAWRQTLAERRPVAASDIPWEGDVPPKPERYVTDLTGVLDAGSAKALNERLAAFERETSNQVVVYVAGTMPYGNTIEDVASRAFTAWQIGQRGKDNGVLFLVFIEDRQMRIEVGYGLEGILTDALAQRIIDDVATPFFKREAYTQGVEASARAIVDVIRGEGLKGAGRTAAEQASILGVSLRSFGLDALGFLLVLSVIATGVFLCASILLVLEKIFGTGPRFGSGGSSVSSGGGRSSASSSSFSSSSSSSSSSFSGGGGRSGGGGASGSW
jgi:uncharacterized protein